MTTSLKTLERLNVAATPHGIRLVTRPDGGEDRSGYYSPFIVPSYSTLGPAIVMINSGDPHFEELGLEIVRRCWGNMVLRQNMAWDMPCAPDPVGRARQLEEMGPVILCVHTAFDRQSGPGDPLADLEAVRAAVLAPLAVAGGLNRDTVGEAIDRGAGIVIVGGAVLRQKDRRQAASDIYSVIRKERPCHHSRN